MSLEESNEEVQEVSRMVQVFNEKEEIAQQSRKSAQRHCLDLKRSSKRDEPKQSLLRSLSAENGRAPNLWQLDFLDEPKNDLTPERPTHVPESVENSHCMDAPESTSPRSFNEHMSPSSALLAKEDLPRVEDPTQQPTHIGATNLPNPREAMVTNKPTINNSRFDSRVRSGQLIQRGSQRRRDHTQSPVGYLATIRNNPMAQSPQSPEQQEHHEGRSRSRPRKVDCGGSLSIVKKRTTPTGGNK